MTHAHPEVTTYLNGTRTLSSADTSRLEKAIYTDLRHIAINRLACESPNSTLTVTSLVHETYLKLKQVDSMSWESRRHYFGAAAEAMRRILIDRARYHLRQRREGEKLAIPLDEGLILVGVKPRNLIELNDAITDLESFDKRLADIVKLNYFVGLSSSDIADLYDESSRTISRKIGTARAWLLAQVEHS